MKIFFFEIPANHWIAITWGCFSSTCMTMLNFQMLLWNSFEITVIQNWLPALSSVYLSSVLSTFCFKDIIYQKYHEMRVSMFLLFKVLIIVHLYIYAFRPFYHSIFLYSIFSLSTFFLLIKVGWIDKRHLSFHLYSNLTLNIPWISLI